MNKSSRNILLAAFAFVVLTTVLATKGYAVVEPADKVVSLPACRAVGPVVQPPLPVVGEILIGIDLAADRTPDPKRMVKVCFYAEGLIHRCTAAMNGTSLTVNHERSFCVCRRNKLP